MLGIVLDVLVLMVLIRLVTGDENESWGKPAIIAVLAAVGMTAANIGALGSPEYALLILLGVLAGLGLVVTLCSMILLDIPFGKSAIIGGGFVAYKTAFILLIALVFSSV